MFLLHHLLSNDVVFSYRYNYKRTEKDFDWRTSIEHYARNLKGALPIVYKTQLTLPKVVVQ